MQRRRDRSSDGKRHTEEQYMARGVGPQRRSGCWSPASLRMLVAGVAAYPLPTRKSTVGRLRLLPFNHAKPRPLHLRRPTHLRPPTPARLHPPPAASSSDHARRRRHQREELGRRGCEALHGRPSLLPPFRCIELHPLHHLRENILVRIIHPPPNIYSHNRASFGQVLFVTSFGLEHIEDIDYFLEGHSTDEGGNMVNRCT